MNNHYGRLIIKSKWIKDLKKGSPLIQMAAIANPEVLNMDGQLYHVYDERGEFYGTGYYGQQNKGCGWIISKEKEPRINKAFFRDLFQRALELRSDYFSDNSTTAFRIFNGEGDGFGGITIDYFEEYYLITWYNRGIYTYKELIVDALMSVVECIGLYHKKRFDDKGQYLEDNDFLIGKPAPEPLIVLENNVKFAIYLNDGPMVGVFLDQREVRKRIRDHYAKGKKVLNTFSYTGAFSVFAVLGGANQTTSVDLANRSRPKTRELFEINGIDPDTQEIVVEDVFNYFKYAARKSLVFDMVILDPPSFARSKKRTFSVAKDYVGLLIDAINITEEGGVIVASTNYSNIDIHKFRDFIDAAFKEKRVQYQILESYSLPQDFHISSDFPEGDYLKVVFVQKLS